MRETTNHSKADVVVEMGNYAMGRGGDWCILRTAGSCTLRLAESLAEAGFDVWTPVETRSKLVGRKRERVEQRMPILPNYVFAKADRLGELLALSRSSAQTYQTWDSAQRRMVAKGHPWFEVFRLHGKVRPQSDRDLASLRSVEADLARIAQVRREKAQRKGPAPRFLAGQVVRVEGGFEGLRLTVVEPNAGKVVKLSHADWMWTVEISAWKLQSVQISQAPPEQGAAIAA